VEVAQERHFEGESTQVLKLIMFSLNLPKFLKDKIYLQGWVQMTQVLPITVFSGGQFSTHFSTSRKSSLQTKHIEKLIH
jgi:hypothetical protein